MITFLIVAPSNKFDDYVNFPSSVSKNTFFVTIIEPSNDKIYHLVEIGEQNEKIDLKCNSSKQTTDKLIELNKESDKNYDIIDELESEKNEENKIKLLNLFLSFIQL